MVGAQSHPMEGEAHVLSEVRLAGAEGEEYRQDQGAHKAWTA